MGLHGDGDAATPYALITEGVEGGRCKLDGECEIGGRKLTKVLVHFDQNAGAYRYAMDLSRGALPIVTDWFAPGQKEVGGRTTVTAVRALPRDRWIAERTVIVQKPDAPPGQRRRAFVMQLTSLELDRPPAPELFQLQFDRPLLIRHPTTTQVTIEPGTITFQSLPIILERCRSAYYRHHPPVRSARWKWVVVGVNGFALAAAVSLWGLHRRRRAG